MKSFLNAFLKFLIIFSGFLLIFGYIWVRFLRTRLPREVPSDIFDTYIFMLYSLLCITYFLLSILAWRKYSDIYPLSENVYTKIKNKIRDIRYFIWNIFYNSFFYSYYFNYFKKPFFSMLFTLVNLVYKPIISFDKYIKENKYIKAHYKNLILNIVNWFPNVQDQNPNNINDEDTITSYLIRFYIRVIFIFSILPSVFILIVFILDIFYFNYIYFTYKVIPLATFPLLFRYFVYSVKEYKEEQIKWLEYACCAIESKEWATKIGYKEGEAKEINIVEDCLKPRRFIKEIYEYFFLTEKIFKFDAGVELEYVKDCEKELNLSYFQTRKRLNQLIKKEIIPVIIVNDFMLFIRDFELLKSYTLINVLYFICFIYLLLVNMFYAICLYLIIL